MILAQNKIREAIERGDIIIQPFSEDQVGPASVDLHLGNIFRRFIHHNKVFEVTDEANFEDITEVIVIKEGDSLLLKPGETVLGITRERITLSSSLCGWIEGRSRFARIGLGVHITSGFAQPGIDNHQVLEITNLGPTPLALHPDTRICQFIFERCEGEGYYNGRFQRQRVP
jgi:dCTP deaminase